MECRKHRLKVSSGFNIYTVDGACVRNKDVDFCLGGNYYRYPKLIRNKNEIWIEKSLKGNDRKAFIIHEIEETKLMRRGIPYGKAHSMANKKEIMFRMGRK